MRLGSVSIVARGNCAANTSVTRAVRAMTAPRMIYGSGNRRENPPLRRVIATQVTFPLDSALTNAPYPDWPSSSRFLRACVALSCFLMPLQSLIAASAGLMTRRRSLGDLVADPFPGHLAFELRK